MNPNDFVSTNEYILAQITIPNDRIDVFTVNVQGKKINNEIWKEYGINFVLNHSKLMQSTIPNNCSLCLFLLFTFLLIYLTAVRKK